MCIRDSYGVVGQEPYDPGHVILPEIMKKNGYATGMFGKWAGGYEGSLFISSISRFRLDVLKQHIRLISSTVKFFISESVSYTHLDVYKRQ